MSELYAGIAPDALYPERQREHHDNKLEELGTAGLRRLRRMCRSPKIRSMRILPKVKRYGAYMEALSLKDIRKEADSIAFDLRRNGLDQKVAARAFALVRRASELTLGKTHYDVQVLGGWVMLQGMIAEMQTGEGKTLTAALPAATMAMAGLPVHVITTNDYLVERDADTLRPLYEALGLSVAGVTAEMSVEERRVAYRSDIVYCSNKTLVFDYLRDLIVLEDDKNDDTLRLERLHGQGGRTAQLFLRGLCYAIVDEADSVLVDEARTPLIISGAQETDVTEITRQAVELARGLQEQEDYLIQAEERRIALTESGRETLRAQCAALPTPWSIPFRREELVVSALTILHLYRQDEHYIIRDGKIVVVDESTGRVMPDRSWGQGLHQMIEYKEKLELTEPRATLKSISYQRFFRHYLRLSGMTGTAAEIRAELGRVYDLPVVRIPTHRPSLRIYRTDTVYGTLEAKWQAVRDRTAALHQSGVPVLIGTRSVAASEIVSDYLEQAGLPHVVLNAKQDADEADMVAQAGQPGSIMIATNMAGRGTDIPLTPEARQLGGLHVILTERHESARIDRQLEGRCARQGDPGHTEAILSLQDTVLDSVKGQWLSGLVRLPMESGMSGSAALRRHWLRHAQSRIEHRLANERRKMVQADEQLEKSLSFSGQGD